ncbi:Hypothetical predicted protein [Paramuricea clavata]|uniref:Uncharacterized protein n=1 Tax=Paramuricea clavata TaxID=317549 RepID=A0A7D9HRB5_PARCT|nr:Hypothetical predicted protein [Paramuricea clavata]
MAYNLQNRIRFIIGLAGFAIFCSGILLFASSYLVEDLLKDTIIDADFGRNHCEYWAALPTILTGAILVLSVDRHFKQYRKHLNCLRICSTLIVMVLVLGVVVEESAVNATSHTLAGTFCNKIDETNNKRFKKSCVAIRKADKMFYVMLFSADIILILSVIVLFAMFADWILFAALKISQIQEHSVQMSERYERFSTSSEPQRNVPLWECRNGDEAVLQPV